MPIMPSRTHANTWIICFTVKVDGELRVIKKEFAGSIKEAMFHEMQLRGLARDTRVRW